MIYDFKNCDSFFRWLGFHDYIFLVKILDDEYMSNGNEQKSFSLFFKRYFQLISLIMSKRTEKNKLPRYDNIYNKRTTNTVEVETYEIKVSEDI